MSRRFWWVNQTKSYEKDISEGVLWTTPNESGGLHVGRRAIHDLRPDDIVFSYDRQVVRAISVVTSSAQNLVEGAVSGVDPDSEGWVVYARPLRTDLRVTYRQAHEALSWGSATLDRNGQTNRRYLSQLSNADAQALVALADVQLPAEESLSGRPLDEVLGAVPTDEIGTVLHRTEQAELRRHLLGDAEMGVCELCGSGLPQRLLVAAHIKPRRDCTEAERRGFDSIAMLLCALGCDALFEWGYVVVDDTGTVVRGRAPDAGDLSRRIDTLVGRRCSRHDQATAGYFASRAAAVAPGDL